MNYNYPSLTKTYHKTAYDALDPRLPSLSAAGKNIIITGGGTGIGAATALTFARAQASSISIIGRKHAQLELTKRSIISSVPESRVDVYALDITQKDPVNAVFTRIRESVGECHILISNAGYISTPAPIKDADDEEWWRSFETNVRGTFLTTQAFLRIKAANAVCIYVSSGVSHVSAGLNNSAYAASKAGAVRVMVTLQLEHPEMRVVCLHPGMIETAMSLKSGHSKGGDDSEY
jgi:NAD(P)-dependent dehydrogenase (short-subunit alcohol dehydrogenase family)